MKYRVIHSTGIALWLTVLLLVWNQSAAAQTLAIVTVQPGELSLVPGQSNVLAIAIDRADQLFGFELHLEFDPAVIQVVDANPEMDGVQVQPAGFLEISQGFAVANQVDNEAGFLAYAMTLLAPAEPASGAGDLLYLSVLAVAPGSSQLSLSVVLASKDGLALPVETIDGSLFVTDGQPSTKATSPAPITPGAGSTETEVTATEQPPETGQPSSGQSNNTIDDRTAVPPTVMAGGNGSPQSPSAETSGRSPEGGTANLTTAENPEQQAVESLELSEAEMATPVSAISGETDQPAVEGEEVAAAVADGAVEINSDKVLDTAQPAAEEENSNVLWFVLAALLILLAGIVLGRRFSAQ
jgi:hypothetical protein